MNLEFQPSNTFQSLEKRVPGLRLEFEKVYGEYPERAQVFATPLESLDVEVERKKYKVYFVRRVNRVYVLGADFAGEKLDKTELQVLVEQAKFLKRRKG